MTASCPNRRRAKRTPSSILVRTFCLRRCAAISATSPNQDGVEGTDSAEVWMITDPSAILVICTSLRESVLFFLLKEAHFMLARYFLAARCAIRGQGEHENKDGQQQVIQKNGKKGIHIENQITHFSSG